MEVGLCYVNSVPRKEVGLGQQVATLVEVGGRCHAVKGRDVVFEECRCGQNDGKSPCGFLLALLKRNRTERGMAADAFHHFCGGFLAVFSSGSAAEQDASGAVALYIIICSIAFGREEKLAAGILPYSSVVACGYGAHTVFGDGILYENTVARVGNAEPHVGGVGPLFGPVGNVDSLPCDMCLVHEATYINCRHRCGSSDFLDDELFLHKTHVVVLDVLLLDILEVAVGAHLQIVGGSLVGYDDTVLVHLQYADGPHLCDRTFYGSL